jgi:hypothetical protein
MAYSAEEVRTDLATFARIHECAFRPYGSLLALVRAARAKTLLSLDYGRGLDLSFAADHYLHQAFDAHETVLCFCRYWSSGANGI